MLINDLQREQKTLQLIREHHLDKLFARNNPSGILICQKHANGVRWRRRDIRNGHLVTNDLCKKEKELAEKLAVNLYRIICIQYIQKQLHLISTLIKDLSAGQQKCTDRLEFVLCSTDQPDALPEEGSQMIQSSDVENQSNTAKERIERDTLLQDMSFQKLLGKVRNCPRVPADFFQISSPYRQLIIPFLYREYSDVINWYNGEYKQNPEHPELLQYSVKLGFKVRSKSEVLIADGLYEAGILFHYEELLLLSGEDPYPDFFVPITRIEKHVWEHFGAMDKQNYFHRTRGKILNYLDHQWFPWINMITTYETKKNPLSEELVEQHISWLKYRYRIAFLDLPPDESFNMYDLAAYAKFSRIGQ